MNRIFIGLTVMAVLAGCGGPELEATQANSEEAVESKGQALTCGGLFGGEYLAKGQLLYNCNRTAYLYHQPDGNVVLYKVGGGVLWSTNTYGQPSYIFAMQTNGELALFNSGYGRLWHTTPVGPAQYYYLLDIEGCGIRILDPITGVVRWIGRNKSC